MELLRDGVDLQALSGKALTTGDAQFFDDASNPPKIKECLDSNNETEKLKGMKTLLALISKGREVPEFFPDVVKNTVVKSIEVKKMVYNYLVHYADYNDNCREMALLSINSFQKDMSASSPLIRGLALRVMTTVRVPDIVQIQLLAAKKCANDSSPYVRKCAANALPKIYGFDHEQLDSLKQILEKLFKDSSTMVLGSAMVAFNEMCPLDYQFIHPQYRKLCHLLADMDEWSQIIALEVLTRYIRYHFANPNTAPVISKRSSKAGHKTATSSSSSSIVPNLTALLPPYPHDQSNRNNTMKRKVVKKAFYSDEEDEVIEEDVPMSHTASSSNTLNMTAYPSAGMNSTPNSLFANTSSSSEVLMVEEQLDVDHQLILKSSLPLLKSRNTGVVLGVCALHFYGNITENSKVNQQISKTMIRILRTRYEVQYIVLQAIKMMAIERSFLFIPYLTDFFIKSTDPLYIRLLKLDILHQLSTIENVIPIIREIETYIKDAQVKFVTGSILLLNKLLQRHYPATNGTNVHHHHPSIQMLVNISPVLFQSMLQIILSTKQSPLIAACIQVIHTGIITTKQNLTMIPSNTVLIKQLLKLWITTEYHKLFDGTSKALIIVCMQEYIEEFGNKLVPDLLRFIASLYTNEAANVKIAILNLAVKISMCYPDNDLLQYLMTYVLQLARNDSTIDINDRARFITAMLGLAPTNDAGEIVHMNEEALGELAEHGKSVMLYETYPTVNIAMVVQEIQHNEKVDQQALNKDGILQFDMTSLSNMVGYPVIGYVPIPAWTHAVGDPSIRDPNRAEGSNSSSTPNGLGFADGSNNFLDKVSTDEVDEVDKYFANQMKMRINQKQQLAELSSSSEEEEEEDSEEEEDEEEDDEDEDDDEEDDEDEESDDDEEEEEEKKSSVMESSEEDSEEEEEEETVLKAKVSNANAFRRVQPVKKPSPIVPPNVTANSITHPVKGTSIPSRIATNLVPSSPITPTQQPTTPQPVIPVITKQVNFMNDDDFSFLTNMNTKPNATTPPVPTIPVAPSTTTMSDKTSKSKKSKKNKNVTESLLDIETAPVSSSSSNRAMGGPVDMLEFDLLSSPSLISTSMPMQTTNMLPPNSSSMIHNNNTMMHGMEGVSAKDKISNILDSFGSSTSNTTTMPPANNSLASSSNTATPTWQGKHNTNSMNPNPMSYSASSMPPTSVAGMITPLINPQANTMSLQKPSPGQVSQESTIIPNNIAEELSAPKLILRPELAGGLSAHIAFRKHATAVAYPNAHCLYIILKNSKESPLKRIKINIPGDFKKTALPDIPQLLPQQEVSLPIEMVLSGISNKQIKFDIRHDGGAFVALWILADWDFFIPLTLSSSNEFQVMCNRLKGFNEIKKLYPLETLGLVYSEELEGILYTKFLRAYHMYVVQGCGIGEFQLAACVKKGMTMDEKVYLTVFTTLKEVGIQINCQDAVLGAAFLDDIKKLLLSK